MSTETVALDLNDIASGKVELANFKDKLNTIDFNAYKDKRVQLQGCAPTWAHLLVAGKLFGIAAGVDFILDDGKDGKVIEVLKK
jgi:hypothetical protein